MIPRPLRLAPWAVFCLPFLFPAVLPTRAQDPPPNESQEAAKPAPDAGATHVVKVEPWKIEVELSGVFEAEQMSPVSLSPHSWSSFSVIKALEHGTRVQQGETLVWLDMKQIDEALHDMEVALELGRLQQQVADNDLELLNTTVPMDLESAERSKRIADEEMNYFLNTNRSFLEESARFSLRSAQESLEYAEEELKQLEKMYGADDLTEETEEIVLKRARNDVERGRFMLQGTGLRTERTLQQDLPRQEQQVIDAARRADLALAKAKVALPVQLEQQRIEREKQRLESQRAGEKLQELLEDRKMMAIESPADGIVYHGQCTRGKWSGSDAVAAQLRPGGKLMPQAVFMTIVAPRPLHVRVDVPEQELHQIQRGMQAKVIPTGYPDLELEATVDQISPFPIASGTFDGRLRVTLPDAAGPIVPGMACKLTMVAYEKSDAITVPAAAVFKHPVTRQRNLVYVKPAEGPPEERQVTIGKKTPQKWEILSGLRAGEQILLQRPNANP